MNFDYTTIILVAVSVALVVIVFAGYFFKKKNKTETEIIDDKTKHLRLQAYERLTLLVDRISIPNLIARVGGTQTTAREMQLALTQNIRQEFDYNITQQIYVSADAWKAVKNLKEQNMLLINQLAHSLPINAKAIDLNKVLLDYLNTSESLSDKINELLSYEAKKLL